jgi:hypothetical protein
VVVSAAREKIGGVDMRMMRLGTVHWQQRHDAGMA